MESSSPNDLDQALLINFEEQKTEANHSLTNEELSLRIAYEKSTFPRYYEDRKEYTYFVSAWNHKKLVKINLVDFSKIECEIPMKHNGFPYIGMHEIPNKGIFCFENCKGGCAFLIRQDNSIEDITSRHVLSSGSSAVYHDNCIYLFGGVNKSNEALISQRYNFTKNRWESISSPLAHPFNISGFGFNQKIIFHQQDHDFLNIYDIRTESYSELYLPLTYTKYRDLFRISSFIYLFEAGFNLLEINIEDLYDGRWKILGNFSPCMSRIGRPVCADNSIYILFLIPFLSLYKFDFATKNILRVKDYSNTGF